MCDARRTFDGPVNDNERFSGLSELSNGNEIQQINPSENFKLFLNIIVDSTTRANETF